MIGAAILFLQATTPSVLGGPVSAELVSTHRAFAECLRVESIALERSDAEFDEIFTAARTACADQAVAAYLASLADLEKRPPSPTGKAPDVLAWELTDNTRDNAKRDIRLEFLRVRARRQSN